MGRFVGLPRRFCVLDETECKINCWIDGNSDGNGNSNGNSHGNGNRNATATATALVRIGRNERIGPVRGRWGVAHSRAVVLVGHSVFVAIGVIAVSFVSFVRCVRCVRCVSCRIRVHAVVARVRRGGGVGRHRVRAPDCALGVGRSAIISLGAMCARQHRVGPVCTTHRR